MIDFLGVELQPPFSYAGLGSSATPNEICVLFKEISGILSAEGGVLRSGGDEGGDAAFESEAVSKEIYLPYRHYNKNQSDRYEIEATCTDIAKSLHPAWHRCSEFAKKAHSRHVYEILGRALDQPTNVVICWTLDGAFDEAALSGKTGILRTAISLALRHGVPVFNAGYQKHRKLLLEFVSERRSTSIALPSVSGTLKGAQKTGKDAPKKGFQTLRR